MRVENRPLGAFPELSLMRRIRQSWQLIRNRIGAFLLPLMVMSILASCADGGYTESIGVRSVHVWEEVELEFESVGAFGNPYVEVDFWVEFEGPDFNKKVHGFWDGGNTFKARVMATSPGEWSWTSHSNTEDTGLNELKGNFSALSWTEAEKRQNPNRRGTVRPTANGRALEYTDGTPFLLIADTHWAAATWRYPFKGIEPDADYVPDEGIGFEEFIQHLKKAGFNSIGFIACFPNWALDQYDGAISDDAGIPIRKPWPKPGKPRKAIDMHDEAGNRPFLFPGKSSGKQDVVADFDSINPAYWQSLDKKMDYMRDNGFVPYLETIRRDHFHTWLVYHDFKVSFTRFLKYVRARYGTHNFIYALLHGDTFRGIDTEPLDEACDLYYRELGPMPFGQPTTAMGHKSTYFYFGHGEDSPWLEMHTSGNTTRNHLIYQWIEEQFSLTNPVPVFNNEPYYVGHKNPGGEISGGNPPDDPERDSYFGRAQAYGSLLSGALAGHVYGSQSWMGITTSEPDMGTKALRFWIPFKYASFSQMRYVRDFLLSEGIEYRRLLLGSEDLVPRRSRGALDTGLDGWAFMMRTEDKHLTMLYFENGCERATLRNMAPNTEYSAAWFNPRRGEWKKTRELESDGLGSLKMPAFPSGEDVSQDDWGCKLSIRN